MGRREVVPGQGPVSIRKKQQRCIESEDKVTSHNEIALYSMIKCTTNLAGRYTPVISERARSRESAERQSRLQNQSRSGQVGFSLWFSSPGRPAEWDGFSANGGGRGLGNPQRGPERVEEKTLQVRGYIGRFCRAQMVACDSSGPGLLSEPDRLGSGRMWQTRW